MEIKVYAIPEMQLGNQSNKKIWAVCDTDADNPSSMDFLEKILKAVQVDLDTQVYCIFPNSEQAANLEPLFKQNLPAKVLCFGVRPKDLGLHIHLNPYEVCSFRNLEVLWAERLLDIENDQSKKRKLWTALQLIQW